MKILTSKPRHDNSVILILKVFCQQTDQDKAFIELVSGAVVLHFGLIDEILNNSDNKQPVLSTVRCDERPFSQSQPPYVWNYMSC